MAPGAVSAADWLSQRRGAGLPPGGGADPARSPWRSAPRKSRAWWLPELAESPLCLLRLLRGAERLEVGAPGGDGDTLRWNQGVRMRVNHTVGMGKHVGELLKAASQRRGDQDLGVR